MRQLNRRPVVRRLDLTKLPGAADVIDELIDELGAIDALVNNSGLGKSAPFLELDWDEWRETLSVDYTTGSTFVSDGGLLLMAAERNDD